MLAEKCKGQESKGEMSDSSARFYKKNALILYLLVNRKQSSSRGVCVMKRTPISTRLPPP
jgi:hypothetical protein